MSKKRGQITIFIIVGILIIVIIILFFIFRNGVVPGTSGGTSETNEEAFLKNCIENKFEDTVRILSLQGGYLNHDDEKPYVNFKFEEEPSRDITYLCYTNNDYFSCVNQEPMLLNHIEQDIKDEIEEDFWNCFDELEISLSDEGYATNVEPRKDSFKVEIIPQKISLSTESKITLTKSGETLVKENFNILFPSRMYEIIHTVIEIVNKEVTSCTFNYLGYSLIYPNLKIVPFDTQANSTKIYTITHKDTNEKFRFAIRGCIIPPGLG